MVMGKKRASMYRAFARWYVSMRECIVTTRSRREVQEVCSRPNSTFILL